MIHYELCKRLKFDHTDKRYRYKPEYVPENEAHKTIRDGGARGVMVIVAGIGHGDTSSNPGLIAFHIALIPLGKV